MRDWLTRWTYRLAALVMIVAVVFVAITIVIPWQDKKIEQLDPRLPGIFHGGGRSWVLWGWVFFLLVCAGLASFRLRALVRRERAGVERQASSVPSEVGNPPVLPPGAALTDPVYVFLSSKSRSVADLLAAAGVSVSGPSALLTSPRRAVFVDASTASTMGSWRGGEAPTPRSDRLESLCHELLSAGTGVPALRGVFVVMTVAEVGLGRGETVPPAMVEAIRVDLVTIRRATGLDLPVYLIVSGLEEVPGFVEFANGRGKHEAKQGRWGASFARPASGAPAPRDALNLLRAQARMWLLEQVAPRPLDFETNARFLGVERASSSLLGKLEAILAGVSPPSDPERPFIRAIDLVAAGPSPRDRAYVYSAVILPLMSDAGAATWTQAARAEDDIHSRRAARTALLASAGLLIVWAEILLGLEAIDPAGLAGFLALLSAWVASLILFRRRWPVVRDST